MDDGAQAPEIPPLGPSRRARAGLWFLLVIFLKLLFWVLVIGVGYYVGITLG